MFLSASVAGGAKQITLHLTWEKGILSPEIKVNTESQVIAIVKGMINVSSCWHLNAQCPYSQLYSVGSIKHLQYLNEIFVANLSAELVIAECCTPSFELN